MMRTVRLFAAVAPAAALLLAPATVAAPYVPKDDATVLERLPLKPTDPLGRELRELRARLAAQPDDLDAAVTIGRHYFRLAMSEGDPRFIGYAEVALRPWARSKEPPRNVLVLRALLRQYRHDFAGALDGLAESSLVLGETDRAERHFKEALSLGVSDQFMLAAYADFLLDRGRPQEVVTLLKDWTRSDPLLLRLALAEKVLGAPVLEEHVRTLKSRFDAAAMRGDKLHQQEEARFNLYLLGQRPRALALAKENWTLQREPRDARILLEAALAANDPKAAPPALDWLARTRHPGPYF